MTLTVSNTILDEELRLAAQQTGTADDNDVAVTVFDANKLYTPADIKLLGAADTAASANLQKLRSAIDADPALKSWFGKNKIDVSHVIAITDTGGKVDVYTF